MKKSKFMVPALVMSVLAIALAMTSCSAVFDSAISGTVKDRSIKETSSTQTGGIADVMVYAYDDETTWRNAYDRWDGKSVFTDLSVPSAKTASDGSFSISSLRWKTNKPVYGKDADCRTIYLLAFHKDYGLTKVAGRNVQSDKSNNFGIVYCDKVTVTKNLVVKFKDKEDNSTTATGSDSTITDTSGFSFRYSYCDGYSADGSDNVKATVNSITNGQTTITVKYKQYNDDGTAATAPTVTVYDIQSDSDWSYDGAETVKMTYSPTDKTYINNSLYFTNDWKTVTVTVNLKDGSTDNAVTDPIYFKWEYNNGDGDTVKSDTITTATGNATINVKFKKGMPSEKPCTLRLAKFDDAEGSKDYWSWTIDADNAKKRNVSTSFQTLILTDDSDRPNVDVYFRKNLLRLGEGISGYIYKANTTGDGYGDKTDDGRTVTLHSGEPYDETTRIGQAVRTTQEVVAASSSQAVINHGKFTGLGSGKELELTYDDNDDTSENVSYKSKTITLKLKRDNLSTVFDIELTSESNDFSNYYFEMT